MNTKPLSKNKEKKIVNMINKLLIPNNTVTTLEVKTALRERWPKKRWTQTVVSGVFIRRQDDLNLTYVDNGTYRVYSRRKFYSKNQDPSRIDIGKNVIITRHNGTRLTGTVINKSNTGYSIIPEGTHSKQLINFSDISSWVNIKAATTMPSISALDPTELLQGKVAEVLLNTGTIYVCRAYGITANGEYKTHLIERINNRVSIDHVVGYRRISKRRITSIKYI